MAAVGKDVSLPVELTTYKLGHLGCPAWSVYLSLLWPPTGIALLFTVPTKVDINPDGTMVFRAVCRTVMSFNLSEDIATIELVYGRDARGGCCGSCYSHAIQLTFTDAGIRRLIMETNTCKGCCRVSEETVRRKLEARPMCLGGVDTMRLANDLGLDVV
jgi:hypothetical protein